MDITFCQCISKDYKLQERVIKFFACFRSQNQQIFQINFFILNFLLYTWTQNNKMYEYNKILSQFPTILHQNHERAKQKKAQYLDKLVSIFKQFVAKCEKQLDHIIEIKINKLKQNWSKVEQYVNNGNKNENEDGNGNGEEGQGISVEERNLVIAQFLIRPFEKFPFTGHKNQKLFKQQYNLIEKASVLIEQTLTQSFKEDEVPEFENTKFFKTIQNHGLGKQSLTKLRLNPQNFCIKPLHEITPIHNKITAISKINNQCIACVGNDNHIEIWDVVENYCLRKLQINISGGISTLTTAQLQEKSYLLVGFSDENPVIMSYHIDSWQNVACSISHTRKVTKLLQYANQYLISGSADGLFCLHNLKTLKLLLSSPHVSSIEDIFTKNSLIYILQKNSSVLEYQLSLHTMSLNFRRSISAGYISIIRFPELTTNFSGIGCHIYGLSQIEITRKFKMQQTNIINVPEMISDFLLLQSKQTSEYWALCVFQSSCNIRMYSLTTQQQVYEYTLGYTGEVGASGYLPKIQILWVGGRYVLAVVSQSQFQDDPNLVNCYQLFL